MCHSQKTLHRGKLLKLRVLEGLEVRLDDGVCTRKDFLDPAQLMHMPSPGGGVMAQIALAAIQHKPVPPWVISLFLLQNGDGTHRASTRFRDLALMIATAPAAALILPIIPVRGASLATATRPMLCQCETPRGVLIGVPFQDWGDLQEMRHLCSSVHPSSYTSLSPSFAVF